MADWAPTPYPLGPPVLVPGFPRVLYPPGVKGHEPSTDGPDVIATREPFRVRAGGRNSSTTPAQSRKRR
jgi:hypothetical protein